MFTQEATGLENESIPIPRFLSIYIPNDHIINHIQLFYLSYLKLCQKKQLYIGSILDQTALFPSLK